MPSAGAGELAGAGLPIGPDDVASVDAGVVDALSERCCIAVSGSVRRSLKQYRHLIASSWISSAQYGHFFTAHPFGLVADVKQAMSRSEGYPETEGADPTRGSAP